MTKYWMKGLKLKKGALREDVQRLYGERGFTERGTIKLSVLNELSSSSNSKVRRRAVLAKTMRRFKH